VGPFEWTYVSTNLQLQKIIHWTMQPSFRPTGSIDFYLDKARSGGDWENVAGPIPDACSYIDPVRWNWNKDMNTFYRVRYDMGVDEWVYSTPVRAIGNWTRKDYALGREISRKETLSYQKLGLEGVLLKRKEWGVTCACCDWDTDEPENGQCPTCFGTGIVGGYYAPVTCMVNPMQRSHQMDRTDRALVDDTKRMVRCLAYPALIKENDLWLDSHNGTRWVIGHVKNEVEIKGVPVIYSLPMNRIPMTDVVYQDPEGTDKAIEIPVVQPTGTENTWKTDEQKQEECEEYY